MKKKTWLTAMLCAIVILALSGFVIFASQSLAGEPWVTEVGTISGSCANGTYTLSYSIETDKETGEVYATVTKYQMYSGNGDIDVVVPEEVEHQGTKYPIRKIGAEAFMKDISVKSVDMKGVTVVGANAFENCSGLTNADLSSVTVIHEGAFKGCHFSSVDLPAVKSIGAYAFQNCSQLLTVQTGTALLTVGDRAFDECANIKYFFIGAERPQEDWGEYVFSNPDIQILIDEGLTSWDNCVGLNHTGQWTDVEKQVSWRISAETGRIGFLSIVSGKSISDVEREKITVYSRDGLGYHLCTTNDGQKYAILTSYDFKADYYSDGWRIQIPDEVYYGSICYPVTEIAVMTGTKSDKVSAVFVGKGIKKIHKDAFSDVFANNIEIYLEEIPEKIYDKNGLISLSDCWKSYKVVCTYGMYNMDKDHIYVNYPLDKHQKDGQGIFYYMDKKLGYAIVGDYTRGDDTSANTSQYMGSGEYSGEKGYVVLPDYVSDGNRYYKVVGIGRYAFYNCNTLKHISLGAFVGEDLNGWKDETTVQITVADCSFRNCTNLRSFSVDPRNKVYRTVADEQILVECDYTQGIDGKVKSTPTKIVKAGAGIASVDSSSYELNTDFSSVTVVDSYAFSNCTLLNAFDFSFVEKIGEHAFENTALESVILSRVTDAQGNYSEITVGDYAFANSAFITSVEIGKIFSLGRFVFQNCPALEEIDLKIKDRYYTDDDGVLYEITGEYAILLQYPAGRDDEDDMYSVEKLDVGSVWYPIREIEAYAFENSSLQRIVIGNTVDIIGKAAFADCAQLRTIEIGANVQAIGAEIQPRRVVDNKRSSGYIDDIIEQKFDLAKVTVYEREVFDNCSVLSNIVVHEDNDIYLSDNNGILYTKDKTKLLVYPEGVTRVSYTVPASVSQIGIEAFENNVHIQRLILPEATREIGAKAFNGCTNLYMLYMRCLDAPLIGDQVFNSAGALSNEGKLTVYCIPEPATWVHKRAEIWELQNVSVEQYVAIQEIPNQALPAPEVYLLYVMDSDGNYLPGMTVTFNCTGKTSDMKSVVVNSNGYAVITLPVNGKMESLAIDLSIEDPNGTYHNYINKSFYLDQVTGFSYVIMQYKSAVSGISCDGQDISVGKVSINTLTRFDLDEDGKVKNPSKRRPIQVVVGVYIDEEKTMATFTKVPQIRLTMEKTDGSIDDTIVYAYSSFSPNEEGKLSGLYTFEIDPDKNNVASGDDVREYRYEIVYEVRLKTESYTEAIVERVEEKLNIDLFYYDFGSYDWGLGANGFTLVFDKNVPLLAGFEWDFELLGRSDSNFELIAKGTKLYVGIGAGISDYAVENLDGPPAIRDNKDPVLLVDTEIVLDGPPVGFTVCGIMEFEKTSLNSPLKTVGSSVTASMWIDVDEDFAFVVVSVPLCVGIEIEGECGYRVMLSMTDEKGSLDIVSSSEIFLTLDVKARLGVGGSILSAGIYGGAEIEMVLDMLAEDVLQYLSVELDFGVYLRINIGWGPLSVSNTFYVSIPKAAGWDTKYEYPSNTARPRMYTLRSVETGQYFASVEEAVMHTVSQYEQEFTAWEGDYSYYNGVDPQLVTYNDELYMFYIDNVFANSNINYNIANYDEYNYLKLVWSKFDPLTGWSTPQIVNTDINNETMFDVCADEDGIHILLRRVLNRIDSTSAESYLKQNGIFAISFANGVFSDPVQLDDGKACVLDFDIKSLNGQVYAAWSANSDYNMLGMSIDSQYVGETGKNIIVETKANEIQCFALKNNTWVAHRKVTGLPTIPDIELARYNQSNILLVIQDMDCDIGTVGTKRPDDQEQDRGLYYIDLDKGTNSSIVLMRLATEDVTEPESLTSINYSEEGILVGTEKDVRLISVDDNGNMVHRIVIDAPVSDYEIVYKDGNLYGIAYIMFEDLGKANLCVRLWADGTFTDEILVTQYEDRALHTFSLYFHDERLRMVGVTSVTKEIENEKWDITYSGVVHEYVEKSADLQLLDVWLDKNGLNLTITNDSLQTIHSISAIVKTALGETVGNEIILSGLTVLPGETKTVVAKDFKLAVFADFYTVEIQSEFVSEENQDNNCIENIPLVFADLSVNARYVEIAGVKYLLVIVQNQGDLPATFEICVENGIVDRDALNRDYLYSYFYDENGGLAAGEYKYFTIELNKVYFTEEYVTVSIYSDREEKNLLNNNLVFSVEKNEVVDYGETYTVYYYINGEQVLKVDYKAGQTIDNSILEKYEYREGYDFKGWMNLMDTMPAHDVHVFGLFQVKTYTVNYYVDGVLYDSKQIEYGSIIPQKEMYFVGHSFSGWFIDEACTLPFDDTNMMAENVNLYGYQQENTYQVHFYLNDNLYQSVSYKYGQIIKIPQYQEQEGHDFKSWTLPNGLTTMPAYDLKLYATDRIKTYTLIYMLDDGNGVYKEKQRVTVQYGQTIPYYDYSAPSGYSFSGWMDRAENGNLVKPETNLKMPNGNLYLYGRNQRREYTVWYYVGGMQVHAQKVVYGERVPVYEYEADGFYFEGWSNPVSVMPAHDVVVYGNVSTERFKIKYYVDDELLYTDEFACGATIQIRSPEKKEGHSFSGWNECYDNDGRLVKNIPEKMPAYDLHIYGTYIKNEFVVYYYVDSVLWKQESIKYDEKVSVLTYSPAEGFTFEGFLDAPDRMPANDVYLFGVTQRKAYKLSYYVNGEEMYTETVLFGSIIAPYTYNVPDGYLISDWKNLPQEMPAKDIRVDAALSRLTYRIHYYVDGKCIEIVEYAFEDPVKAYIYTPERGYRFNGFVNEPKTMPDRDMHVYGVTEKETHTVYYYIGDNVVFQDAYAFNDAVILREAPLVEGYRFVGWNDVPRRMLDEDVHVYGNYIPNEYVVSYSLDEKTVITKSYSYGSEIETPIPDPIEGYTFVGWINEPKTMPSHDILVVGQLERNLYKVSYYVDDVLLKSETLPWGADVDLSSTDTDKYTVTEWTMDGVTVQSLTVRSKDIRLDATFVEKKAEREFSFAWVLPTSVVTLVTLFAAIGVAVIRKSRGRSGR